MFEGSPFYSTDREILHRKIEAAIGLSLGMTMLTLVLAGMLVVRFKWPDSEEERQYWRNIGRQPGTVEIYIGGGRYITFSMTVGPFAILRPWLTFGGSLVESSAKYEEKAGKLARRAEEKDLTPAMAERKSVDAVGAAFYAGASTMFGGRTASGMIANLSDYRAPQLGRVMSGLTAPLIPGLPQVQEISRMSGVQLDPKKAGYLDFLMPVAGSAAEKRNFFYDPLNEQTTARIVKTLTGGSYPLATLPIHRETEKAYKVLGETGWRPPAVQNQAREIGEQFRAFDQEEMEKYRELRGRYLKKGVAEADLSGLTPNEKLDELDTVAEEASKDAGEEVIDMIEGRTGNTGASPKVPALRPRPQVEMRP